MLILAITIGSVWELFEYVSGITRGEPGYWFDTLKDLSNDVTGAVVAWALYAFTLRKLSRR